MKILYDTSCKRILKYEKIIKIKLEKLLKLKSFSLKCNFMKIKLILKNDLVV